MVASTQSNSGSALSPAQVDSAIATSILSKTLDAARQQGASVVQLIDSAAETGPQPGDALVAKATGLGSLLDISA